MPPARKKQVTLATAQEPVQDVPGTPEENQRPHNRITVAQKQLLLDNLQLESKSR